MGRIMVRDFQRTAGRKVQVVVADRDTSAVRGLRVETTLVDVTDPASLRRALEGAYAVIASLPYRFNLEAMRGALDAGTHYIDLGGLFHVTRRQLELAPEFERRGIMAILGMGSAPGIVNVLAVLAARGLDTVREIHCLVGSVDRTRFRNTHPLWFGYSADTLLDEFTMPSAVYRAGRFTMVPPLDPRERTTVRFPAPVGAIVVDTTLHSEVATLPLSFRDRGIREVTFRQGFDTEFRDKLSFLVQLGLADTTALPSCQVRTAERAPHRASRRPARARWQPQTSCPDWQGGPLRSAANRRRREASRPPSDCDRRLPRLRGCRVGIRAGHRYRRPAVDCRAAHAVGRNRDPSRRVGA